MDRADGLVREVEHLVLRPRPQITARPVTDRGGAAQYYPPDQIDRVIGLTAYNKFVPVEDLPAAWAVREGDPDATAGYEWA